MPDFTVTFTRTQTCTVVIKAKNAEAAEEKFGLHKYDDDDVEVQDTADEFEEAEKE